MYASGAHQVDLVAQSNAYLLARTEAGFEAGISVRALLRQYKIESLREYQHRSRAALNMQRQSAAAAPVLRRDEVGSAI